MDERWVSDAGRLLLLQIARAAMIERVHGRGPTAARPDGELARPAGAFVTLHAGGELRGCIGLIEATVPVAFVVAHCAAAAATEDPRFLPVTVPELEHITLEISVLTPPQRIADPLDFEVGTHGLIVEHDGRRGLLLPQVAIEWEWDREMFLCHTARKAGLAPTVWQQGAAIFRFSAEVFGEADPRRS
jgi:AmmeMemoRadiSam system protein A